MFQAPNLIGDIWRKPDTSTDAEIIPSLISGYMSGRKVAKENRDAKEAAHVTGGEVKNPRSFMDSFGRAFFGAGAIQAESNPLYQLKMAEARAQLAESGVKIQGTILRNQMLEQQQLDILEDQRRMSELQPYIQANPTYWDKIPTNPFRSKQYQGLWESMQRDRNNSQAEKARGKRIQEYNSHLNDIAQSHPTIYDAAAKDRNWGDLPDPEQSSLVEKAYQEKKAKDLADKEAAKSLAVEPKPFSVTAPSGKIIEGVYNPKSGAFKDTTSERLTEVESKLLSDALARKRSAQLALSDPVKGITGKATLTKMIEDADKIISKYSTGTPSTNAAPAITAPAPVKSKVDAANAIAREHPTWTKQQVLDELNKSLAP